MSDALRLLLVNGEEDGLLLIDRAMMREFPEAETILCRSALEALRQLEREAVDIVITDNRMPMMSGVEFVRRLRASGFQMPVIMLCVCDEQKSEAFAAGVGTFIPGGEWPEIQRIVRSVVEGEQRLGSEPPSA